MNKFKRAVCLLVVFVFTAGMLVGCSLFERDVNYYNNLVVATVGSDIKITKKQLIQAYNSSGYQYVTQQGLSVKEAYDKTLDDIIDREILVELSIQKFSFANMSDSEKSAHIKSLRNKSGVDSLFYNALFENEKAEVRRAAFDALDSYYEETQDKVREERKLSVKTPEEAENPNTKSSGDAENTFKKFEPLVTRSADNTVFDMDISSYVNRELYTANDVWSPDISHDDDSIVKLVKQEALSRVVSVLKNNEKGMKVGNAEATIVEISDFLKIDERAVIGREIGRMIEDYSKTVLARRFEDIFNLGISAPIDRSLYERASDYEAAIKDAVKATAGNDDYDDVQKSRASALKDQAYKYYRSQVLAQYNRFIKKMDDVEGLGSKVLEGLSDIYWLPSEIADNYFTVSHILIGYSDEQKEEFENIKSEFASGGYVNVENYNSRMQALAAGLKTQARDEFGNLYGEQVSASDILSEIETAIGGKIEYVPQPDGSVKKILVPDGNLSEEERINLFREFIFKYNSDPGMMKSNEYEYVIGVAEGASKMVAEFTDASRELFGYKKIAKMEKGKPVLGEDNKPVYEWEKRDELLYDAFGNPVTDAGGNHLRFSASRSSMTYDFVMSDYGAHIIMYTRPLSDFIYNTVVDWDFVNLVAKNGTSGVYSSFESDLQNSIDSFLFAPINSYGDKFGSVLFANRDNPADRRPIVAIAKTMFDAVIEKMNKPSFDTQRVSLVTTFKSARVGDDLNGKLVNKITVNRGNFKDLVK